jgi:hypothetical protein
MKTENLLLLGLGVVAIALILKAKNKKNEPTIVPMDDAKVNACKDQIAKERMLMRVSANFDWAAWEKEKMQACLSGK